MGNKIRNPYSDMKDPRKSIKNINRICSYLFVKKESNPSFFNLIEDRILLIKHYVINLPQSVFNLLTKK